MSEKHDEKAPAVVAKPPVSTAAISALARSLNELLLTRNLPHELNDILAAQAVKLDTLFHHLLMKNAAGAEFNEAFGLATALRAQKQCRHTIETISAQRDRQRALDEK